ncbi:uncharacterized protein K460DRAFT_66377 [Cucurbitaria berberidis CBS 394.84]|uniref:Uncharacterized protein n=1 Tax=Cucurbitaria berberidis CBS 394.84 TaxID=1168544 RepID=A0A9P4GKG5_9PLEO|nr:uncharacterized protein K460DRAFT_66377 [Cucurbitaria berberidis CBS 394.84]KAF1847968.1 hypothetical protein K460DRAFT_66377 [Cucurbitaria berberidis CBS 394.84]
MCATNPPRPQQEYLQPGRGPIEIFNTFHRHPAPYAPCRAVRETNDALHRFAASRSTRWASTAGAPREHLVASPHLRPPFRRFANPPSCRTKAPNSIYPCTYQQRSARQVAYPCIRNLSDGQNKTCTKADDERQTRGACHLDKIGASRKDNLAAVDSLHAPHYYHRVQLGGAPCNVRTSKRMQCRAQCHLEVAITCCSAASAWLQF